MTFFKWKSKMWIISNSTKVKSVTQIFTEVQKDVQTQFTVLCS